VRFSNEKIIKTKDLMVAGSQPQAYIETALITLGHLALFSEDVEVEVYMCENTVLDFWFTSVISFVLVTGLYIFIICMIIS
jgi:hypothetical protein